MAKLNDNTDDTTSMTAESAKEAERFIWGDRIVPVAVGSAVYRMFEPRRKHASELLEDARRWCGQGREYLVQADRRLTYDALFPAVERLAATFRARGVRPGDAIMLLAANSVDWALCFWAAMRCDAVAVLGNAWWAVPEIENALALTDPRLIVADDKRREILGPSQPVLAIEEIEGLLADSAAFDPVAPVAKRDENAPAMILFTSGTTGLPKGAIISHRSVVAAAHAAFALGGVLPHQLPEDKPQDGYLLFAPLFHIGGPLMMTAAALAGDRIVMTVGRFDPVQILKLIEQEKITRVSGVLTAHSRILASPAFADADVSSVTGVLTGGMKVHPEIVARMREAYPRDAISVSYGMTEIGSNAVTVGGEAYRLRPTATGKPFPTVEIRIDEPDQDGIGEVLVRSPTNMTGYLALPDDKTLDDEGWIHSGDLGRIDEEGFLHVTGRKKEVIIRGGENVAAPHVESVLLERPELQEVAVVGLEDADWGEVVGAVIICRPGQTISQAELEAHCRDRLAHYQVPTRWWLRDEPLPVNETNKVQKHRLIAEWLERGPRAEA